MTSLGGAVSLSSLTVSSDLPGIPGRQRNVYKASRRGIFRRRRAHSRSFNPGSGRRTFKAGRRGSHTGGRRWPKRVLIGLVSLVVVILLASVAGYFYVDSELSGIHHETVSALTPAKSGQPMDVLLVGSDSRACESSAAQAAAFGSKTTVTGQRSDTLIVARFLSGDRVEMLSIPRDLWVPIAGQDYSAKINAAFNNGPSPLVETIQKQLGIPINHVILENFCGLSTMVNALGGIYLDFPDPVRDAYSGLNVTHAGCQLVNGSEALSLVRSRHLYYFKDGQWNYDGMSDFSRIERQQAFFHGLLARVHQVIPNVFRLNSFLEAAVAGVAVDSGFSGSQMISLAWSYHGLSESNLYTAELPVAESVIDGQDVLLTVPEDKTEVAAFLAGNVGSLTTAAGTRTGTHLMSESGVVQVPAEPWNPTPC